MTLLGKFCDKKAFFFKIAYCPTNSTSCSFESPDSLHIVAERHWPC